MLVIGYIVLGLGLLVGLYWQLRFLAVTYDRSVWWLLGCLFVPFVDFVFLWLNFKATRKAFGLSLLGLAVAAVGGWMAGMHWWSDR